MVCLPTLQWFSELIAIVIIIIDEQNCATVVNVQRQGSNTLNTNTQVISNSGFSCHGRITGFAVSLEYIDGLNSRPSIQVWRPSGSTYTRISQYQLNQRDITELASYALASVSFVGDERIEFQSGDVIGYYLPNNPRYTVWNIETVGFVSYSTSADNALASVSINDANVETNRQPLIQMTIGKIDELCCIFIWLAVHI